MIFKVKNLLKLIEFSLIRLYKQIINFNIKWKIFLRFYNVKSAMLITN